MQGAATAISLVRAKEENKVLSSPIEWNRWDFEFILCTIYDGPMNIFDNS